MVSMTCVRVPTLLLSMLRTDAATMAPIETSLMTIVGIAFKDSSAANEGVLGFLY